MLYCLHNHYVNYAKKYDTSANWNIGIYSNGQRPFNWPSLFGIFYNCQYNAYSMPIQLWPVEWTLTGVFTEMLFSYIVLGSYFLWKSLCLFWFFRQLDLKKPIYQEACVYGHFKPGFTWEVPKKLVYKSGPGNAWGKQRWRQKKTKRIQFRTDCNQTLGSVVQQCKDSRINKTINWLPCFHNDKSMQ